MPWSWVCIDVCYAHGSSLAFWNQPLTCLSPSSPQGSDSTRTWPLSRLVWYMSICLIWSVHLSGPSGLIRVLISPQIFSGILACPGGFQRAYRLQLVNKKLWYVSLFSFLSPWTFSRMFLASQHISHLFYSSVGECHWGYLDQVGCVMHLLSPLVPWSRSRMKGAAREQNDACSSAAITSSWTVRHYEAVGTTSEPYADNVPLSFVPLHYGLSPFVFRPLFFHLSALRSFMLCSPVSFSFCSLVFLL